jgi:hypothetical protein
MFGSQRETGSFDSEDVASATAGSSGFGYGIEKGFESSSYTKADTAVGTARPPMLIPETNKEVKGSEDEESSGQAHKVTGTEDKDKALIG